MEQYKTDKAIPVTDRSRDGAIGIDGRGVGVRVPAGSKFSLLHIVQAGSGVHPTSYKMGTGGFFPGGKAAKA
jgi:hypothetical protein